MHRCETPLEGYLAQRADEELVWLAQRARSAEAADALVLRYREEISGLVALLLHGTGLAAEDVEDAQQESFFPVRRAVIRFDLRQLRGPSPCHFRSFLGGVVRAFVCNFVKARRRRWCRDRRLRQTVQRFVPAVPRGAAHWLSPPPRRRDEPALHAERQEALAALGAAVSGLNAGQRRIWEAWCGGASAKEIGRELGITASTVRRRLHGAVERLRTRVGLSY